jgi:beta-lactamase class A
MRRRSFLVLGSIVLEACVEKRPAETSRAASVPGAASEPFADVEREIGGRVGVMALDTGTGRELARRADERFAMCSTFKWLLGTRVLAGSDRGELDLAREIDIAESDLLEYAPVTRAHAGEGRMTIDALAAAAITVSDNTAANLLLREIGGPAGLSSVHRARGGGRARRVTGRRPRLGRRQNGSMNSISGSHAGPPPPPTARGASASAGSSAVVPA